MRESPSAPVNLQPAYASSTKATGLNSGWSKQVALEVKQDSLDDKDSTCWLEKAKIRSFTSAEQTAALFNLLAEVRKSVREKVEGELIE